MACLKAVGLSSTQKSLYDARTQVPLSHAPFNIRLSVKQLRDLNQECEVVIVLGSLFAFGVAAVSSLWIRHELAKRRRAEEERARSEELYRSLARHFPNGAVILFDHDLRYTLAEGIGLMKVDLVREKMEGRTIWELFSPDTCAVLEPLYRAALAGTAGVAEVSYANRVYTVHALPVRNTSGAIFAGMVMTQDISERKALEEELRKARDELERRVQERTVALGRANGELRTEIAQRHRVEERLHRQLDRLHLLHQVTRAMSERQDVESIFGVVLGSLETNLPIDFGCFCFFNPLTDTLAVAAVGTKSRSLALSLGMEEQVGLLVDQNGLRRCLHGQTVYEPDTTRIPMPIPRRFASAGLRSLVATPLVAESRPVGLLMAARRRVQAFSSGECEFLRQLSEHVGLAVHQAQLYQNLQSAYDDLRQTQQAVVQQERLRILGQLASGIAHDINNALSPVAIYTEILLESEPNLSTRAREYLTTIQRAMGDVAHTVTRMREVARKREEQTVLLPVHLNQLAPQVVKLTRARWRDLAQQQGVAIDVQTELAAELPPILGVESELRDALTNLVLNAADAMPAGGTITIRTRATPNHIVLEVNDTGIGMDEEMRQHCLEPFYTTKGERGTGLGLTMVYGVLQRHSGEIAIESAPARGTTIRLSFPPPQSLITEGANLLEAETVLGRLRILVVDDDPCLRTSLREALTADGHEVHTAEGGQAGVEAFRSAQAEAKPFAVVITDLGMPNVDGREVAQAVKQLTPATPVILLTGWGQQLREEGELPAHVDQVLSKPPKMRELRAALVMVTRAERGTTHQ